MKIAPQRLAATLVIISLSLIILHLVLYGLAVSYDTNWLYMLADRFNVDHESSLPTWFSQALLLAGAAMAFFIARADSARLKKYWYVVAGILLILSIDEGSGFHETLGVFVGQALGWQISLGFAVLRDWVLLSFIAVIIVGLFLFKFVRLLPVRTRWLLAASVVLFVGGALVVETIHFTTLEIAPGGADQRISNAIEEGFEMLGVVAVIYALADYAARRAKSKKIEFVI